MTAADLHTLTGAYALHALGADERGAFERHMRSCEACATEVREFSATAARLGLAAAAGPRGALRAEVLRRIESVRQEPPRRTGVHQPVARRRVARLTRWALAACLAAAAGLGGTAVWQYQRADRAAERAERAERRWDAIAAVLAASDARTTTVRLGGGATATVVVSRGRGRAVFVASGMSEPPPGKVYQLWFDDQGTMRPAGVMDPGRSTEAVLMRGAVDGARGIGVTVEPAGGSRQPTSSPIAAMRFAT
ncbi:anti-sigma factor [Streptomyces pluripotens]|uniref:Regulator of SigK n=1 Tax=Streptomyces pluripotens TaxID=1355015 RepID=A0A221P4J3_9ACTN|nr:MULTISPECIES: anti-sigma factor [Streptomyces]ARP72822.1 anti-sigma factor [Streptomyces pluripotens]ASN27072.1 anti-sigma factor [Streptomyces pluripotens]KIE23619.1 anti-sigma factor [Streptomyces sp. MUSC 125]MCH0561287.1 anti-sigma factor [Streptomyces sp. MUM 16J]